MRQLGSKLLAGGLSAGVVLLWWPMFFPTASVTTWLGRGIVWTLSFELLLVALSPFELALWSTHRGERITRRVEAGRALLEHQSPKRRIGRRAALAVVGLAVPLSLIAVGVSRHIPAGHSAAPEVTRVTRVVRVVKPVRVERVVKVRTVSEQVPAEVVYTAPAATALAPARHVAQHDKTVSKKPPSAPPATPEAGIEAPATQTTPTTTGDGSSAPQTPSVQPTAGQSGAAAQPTT